MRNSTIKTTAELYHQELAFKNQSKADYEEMREKLNYIFPSIDNLLEDEHFLYRI